MTDWEPATEAEAAMRDALRANDQELYFRILARTDLLLPVSAEALAGQAPMGWGTWTTNGRTHVLAFTSDVALRACLGANGGSSRRCAYHDLAAGWPNHEWWLAVNPGLPIEGYLPAWFVSQLSRGDVRLPGRTLGARARLEQVEQLARSRAAGGEPPAPEPPRGSPPAPPYGATRPPVATPPRRGLPDPSAEETEALRMGQPDPRAAEPPPSNGAPEPGSSWLTNPRRQLRADPAHPDPGATPPPNGQPSGRNSFFEPAPPARGTGPAPVSPLRSQDRTVPPSRLGEPGRAFPRRRPYRPDQAGDEPTRAFRFTDPAPAEQPTPPHNQVAAGVPAADQTQALPRRQPRPEPAVSEPTQALPRRMPPQPAGEPVQAPGEPTQPLPRPMTPVGSDPVGQEPTQSIPQPVGPVHPTDPLPAEPTVRVDQPMPAGYADSALSAGHTDGVLAAGYADGVLAAGHTDGALSAGHTDADGAAAAGYAHVDQVPPAGYAGAEQATEAAGFAEPARSPSPLVIEGTVVESRDLADVAPGYPAEHDAVGYPAEPDAGAGYQSDTVGQPDPVTGPGHEPAGYEPAASAYEPAASAYEPAASVYEPAASVYEPAASAYQTGVAESEPADGPGVDPTGTPPPVPPALDFHAANDVEEELLAAAGTGSTDTFLSTLLLARVLLPVAPDAAPGSRPGETGFVWRTEQLDGEPYVIVYTSPERLADHVDPPVETVQVKFVQLIRRWPDEQWSFAVNPGTPVGAKLPGEQIVALANWAAEVGLGDDVEPEPVEPAVTAPAEEPAGPARYATTPEDPNRPPMMQKTVAPSQLAYYLERGYDRVSGFVHRAGEVGHLNTPAKLYAALGLGYPDSPYSPGADEIYVLRWPAYRPSLYRIPYGGQNESAMRAMEGWVIERPPFRGNGFAPGESSDVVAEFKVDSARLPHGTQLWRIGADGSERVIATLDTDALLWRPTGER
ncbi:SseB family protein [Micromonospora sp. NBRC 101691]|uniref:SseB family protein n=1 Tax=Micromonospora sp. NBRC 101691 TaxID=3032198 RepID=UPI00255406B9|nr:SseB family protein [Micromonospora sp. NBRC 101691]